MKKLICVSVLGFLFLGLGSLFAKTIHVSTAYAMKKWHGEIYVIRVQLDDGYHDWYVTPTDKTWLFYGYESDDEIIVDKLIDIAIEN